MVAFLVNQKLHWGFSLYAFACDGVTRGTTDVPGDMLTRKPERVINSAVVLMNILLPCATLREGGGEEERKKIIKKKLPPSDGIFYFFFSSAHYNNNNIKCT